MFMIAVEATIVSTAMPQIVAQLGGLHLYSWIFSSFLLTQTAMTVVFGKLSDVYGRKPIMLIGITIFLIGSILAGFSRSMMPMIFFRLIQGVGAGAVQPVAMTIVADLYPARERGKIQGYLASVWAISAVLGPLAGGLIIRHWSWPWIFWINVPIGVIAAAGFTVFLHERELATSAARSTLQGPFSFTIAVASLLIALTGVGTSNNPLTLAGGRFIVPVRGTLRHAGAARRRSHDFLCGLGAPAYRRGERCRGALRDGAHRTDNFPADVRARSSASIAGDRGSRTDDDAGWLAAERDTGRAKFSSLRSAADFDRGQHASPGRCLRVRASDAEKFAASPPPWVPC